MHRIILNKILVWDNRKLRYSRDKYKKGNTHQQEDNFQTLLQQYKDIQGQPVKQQEDLNELGRSESYMLV